MYGDGLASRLEESVGHPGLLLSTQSLEMVFLTELELGCRTTSLSNWPALLFTAVKSQGRTLFMAKDVNTCTVCVQQELLPTESFPQLLLFYLLFLGISYNGIIPYKLSFVTGLFPRA